MSYEAFLLNLKNTPMPLAQDLINELTQEAAVARKYLERVPFDKIGYRPHPKSETLEGLAIHVAEIVAWWKECMLNKEARFYRLPTKGNH